MLRSRTQLAADNLFLRKGLACYVERKVRLRRTDNPSRIALVLLSRFVGWRDLLTIVRPETFVGWQRSLFRLFWRAKSDPRGRPRIPAELQRLIAEIATANRTWGEERIAAELRLKLGLTVSPRTVRRYMPPRPRTGGGQSPQTWATFLRNHAGDVLACDFLMVVTATFQRIYIFVILDIAEWSIQQFRNGLPLDTRYRFLHDRDSLFAAAVDDALHSMSLRVLRTPGANAHCERFVGSARRECLDCVIPLSERHLRRVLAEWVTHYNRETTTFGIGTRSTRRALSSGNADRTPPDDRTSSRGVFTPRQSTPRLRFGAARGLKFLRSTRGACVV